MAWTLPTSVALHIAALLALGAWVTMRHLDPPPVRSVDVQVMSEQQFRQATGPATPPVAMPAPLTQAPLSDMTRPPMVAEPTPAPAEVQPGATIAATNLFAGQILSDPANREIRDTLPLLELSERITQLCNIEGLEQIRLQLGGATPDTMVPSAMAETTVAGTRLEASGGAYRVARKWYGIAFTCAVAPDYQSVGAFTFALGDAIPQDEWESHNLIEEDMELD